MQTYTFKQLCQFESQLAKAWKSRETLLSHDWMVLFLHSLSTLRIWFHAFIIYTENLTQCIRYRHWESDSMHSLSTVRIWLHASVIYPENHLTWLRSSHFWPRRDNHSRCHPFPEVWAVMWCGVLCISFSWGQTPLSFITNAFFWKSDNFYIFSELPSFYRLKIKFLPLGGRISTLLLPVNLHGQQQQKKSFQFSVLWNDKDFYNFNILRLYLL